MKKITKRIMALMLSLVMILGCIPSFINEASAEMPASATIAQIINATEGFPTTTDKAWVNANGCIVYYSGGKLNFNGPSGTSNYRGDAFTGTLEGTSYKFDNGLFYFNMENGILTSISSYEGSYEGTYKVVLKPISEVDITSSGVLAKNIQTLKYGVTDDSHCILTDDPAEGWYNKDNIPCDFSKDTLVHKTLTLTPDPGYKFDDNVTVIFVGNPRDKITPNADGTLTVETGTKFVLGNSISLDFERPSVANDLIALDTNYEGSKDAFNSLGTTLNGFKYEEWYRFSNNINDLGFFLLESKYVFDAPASYYKDDCLGIASVYYRNKDLKINETSSDIGIANHANLLNNNKIMGMNDGDVLCFRVIDDINTNYIIYIYEKIDLRKALSLTIPTAEGTTVETLRNSATLETTATTNTASFKESGSPAKRNINVYEIVDGNISSRLNDTDALEKEKEYFVQILVSDVESLAYAAVSVNNVPIEYNDTSILKNRFNRGGNQIQVYYIINLKTPVSSGSKKYKAIDDKKTTEKITGTGKKGSKRTIIPEPNRKVLSVIVTDKDGNKYEVTNEGDGTYSFIQPGTNVDVEVKYKNRLIELTIGSLDASVDDVHHNLDVVPKVVNDRTMLPIRFVAENLGAKVDWDEKDPDTVIITRGDTKIVITLGSDKAYVNGQEYILDSVAFAENDRTYLPVRFVSEKLNAIVEWNEAHPMDVKIYERQ